MFELRIVGGSDRPERQAASGWTTAEHWEFERVVRLLSRRRPEMSVEFGTTDVGEPWVVFHDPATDETPLHIARCDGRIVALDETGSPLADAETVRQAVQDAVRALRIDVDPSMRKTSRIVEGNVIRLGLGALAAMVIEKILTPSKALAARKASATTQEEGARAAAEKQIAAEAGRRAVAIDLQTAPASDGVVGRRGFTFEAAALAVAASAAAEAVEARKSKHPAEAGLADFFDWLGGGERAAQTAVVTERAEAPQSAPPAAPDTGVAAPLAQTQTAEAQRADDAATRAPEDATATPSELHMVQAAPVELAETEPSARAEDGDATARIDGETIAPIDHHDALIAQLKALLAHAPSDAARGPTDHHPAQDDGAGASHPIDLATLRVLLAHDQTAEALTDAFHFADEETAPSERTTAEADAPHPEDETTIDLETAVALLDAIGVEIGAHPTAEPATELF